MQEKCYISKLKQTNSKNKNSNHIKTVQKTFDFSFAFLIKNYKFKDQVFKYYFTKPAIENEAETIGI